VPRVPYVKGIDLMTMIATGMSGKWRHRLSKAFALGGGRAGVSIWRGAAGCCVAWVAAGLWRCGVRGAGSGGVPGLAGGQARCAVRRVVPGAAVRGARGGAGREDGGGLLVTPCAFGTGARSKAWRWDL
jgi:hypothetical protein